MLPGTEAIPQERPQKWQKGVGHCLREGKVDPEESKELQRVLHTEVHSCYGLNMV